ncbi:MAG: exodeoxyribonuclease VII large subunit [Candidatus Aenigmatarchaeota archaeon]
MKKIEILICLVLSLIGSISLFYLVKNKEIEKIPIEEIDNSYLGKTITTTGKVASITYSKGHIFLTLYDKKSINVAIFSNVAKFLEKYPKKGDNLIITGVVSEYNGKLQIIPRKPQDVVIK